jgi:hypothetical protein
MVERADKVDSFDRTFLQPSTSDRFGDS